MFLRKIALATVVHVSLVHGWVWNDSYGGYSDDYGPFWVPMSKYDKLMDSPNATGNYPIQAPRLGEPYSVSGMADGWSWNINVVADIAMSESNTTAPDQANKTFTGVRVVLQTPIRPNAPVHESWELCALEWRMNMSDFPAKLRQDDGSCTSVLSKGCIKNIELRTVREFSPSPSDGLPCSCPDYEALSDCNAEEIKVLKSGGACIAKSYNSTLLNKWPDGKLMFIRYGSAPHERGDLAAYNQTGSAAWPVLIMFGPSRRAHSNGTGLIEISDTAAKLSCLRAKEAVAGSLVPGPGAAKQSVGSQGSCVPTVITLMSFIVAGFWFAM